eukprot:s1821_g12.t1
MATMASYQSELLVGSDTIRAASRLEKNAAFAVFMGRTPDVLWAQRRDGVFLTIDLNEAQEIKVSLDSEKLGFFGKSAGNHYEFTLDFFAPIVKEESKWSPKRLIEFYLKKKSEGTWTSLSKKKLPWVKVDWKRWQDSDDEEEGKSNQFNLDGLGDMNLGDIAGGEEPDSDDEATHEAAEKAE